MSRIKSIFLVLLMPVFLVVLLLINSLGCSSVKVPGEIPTDTIFTNIYGQGFQLQLTFTKGEAHNHPLMAVWITDTSGNYIETLYIAESIGKGYFDRVDKSTGKWQAGAVRRPASLPVWAFNRNVREADGIYIPTPETSMPDGITGATPQNNFVLVTKTSSKSFSEFDIYFEINQTWDWNEYWTNNKFPDDEDYKTSCQPALVYKARINLNKNVGKIPLDLIGRSHYSGNDGKIYTDLETITTAKNITASVIVEFHKW